MSDAWKALMEEAAAFEAWYGTRMSVNAWVGVSPLHGLYGGWSVEGDPPEAVIADLIRIVRGYRERIDKRRAEDEAEQAEFESTLRAAAQ